MLKFKHSFLIVSLLLFSTIAYCQQKIIDSLLINLAQQSDKKDEYVKTLNELGYYYSLIDPEKGVRYSEEAIILSKQLDLKLALATAYSRKAINLRASHKDSLAMLFFDKAIKNYKELKDDIGVAKVYFNKAMSYYDNFNYYKSNENILKANTIFKKEKDSFLMARAYNSLGINYMMLTDYTKALENYNKAVLVYELTNKTQNSTYASILTNMGILYGRLNNLNQALNHHKKAITIFRVTEYKIGLANALTNAGNVYDDKKEPKKAISLYKEALSIMQNINNKKGIASALANIGIAYTKLKEYEKAVKNLLQAEKIYKSLSDFNNLSVVYNTLGGVYLKQNNILRAKTNTRKAIKFSQKIGNLKTLNSALEQMAEVFSASKNYKQAYITKNQSIIIKDSFLSSEKRDEIAALKAKFKYEKESTSLKLKYEKESTLKQSEIDKQIYIKNMSVLVGSFVFLIGFAGFLFYKRRKETKAKQNETELKAKIATTELKMLRAQIKPHFIFNTLNSIRDYIQNNDKESADTYLTKFAKVIRASLDNSANEKIVLSKEIEFLENYLYLERKRLENKLIYNIYIDKKLDIENTVIPPLLLQPFIENSIWHGISKKENDGGSVIIAFKEEKGMLHCSIEDNGVGRLKSKKINNKSYGLDIIQSRIELLNHFNKKKIKLQLVDKIDGLLVVLKIPMELAF